MAQSTPPAGLIERTTYGSDGYVIDLWVMRPRSAGRVPVVVYNHGSRQQADGRIDSACSTLSFETPLWRGVRDGSCAVVFPEGRGYGASTGPQLADCGSMQDVWTFLGGRARDVVAAVAWLDSQGWADTSRVLLCGCSHGGIVSFLAQADLDVRGTVLQAPAAGDQAQEVTQPALIRALALSRAPILLQHAQHDLHAPVEFSRSLHRLGRERAKDFRLHEYPLQPSMPGHDQFAWGNRAIWGADFDSFARGSLGISGSLVCDPP